MDIGLPPLPRFCQAYVSMWMGPADSPEEKQRKMILVPTLSCCWPVGVITLVALSLDDDERFLAKWWGALVFSGAVGATLLVSLLTKRLPTQLIGVGGVTCGFGLLMADWATASVPDEARYWPAVIVCMDTFLAVRVEHSFQYVMLHATGLWLVVAHMEQGFRLGLWELEGWSKYPDHIISETQNCVRPPCAVGARDAFINLATTLAVLYLDFGATRGFAEGLQRQQVRMQTAVRVAGRVAGLLAAYATTEARSVVHEEGDALPEALQVSYLKLLDNLDSYRVFLPDSLLAAAEAAQQQQAGDGVSSSQEQLSLLGAGSYPRGPPGLGEDYPQVAVCFTDIQSSTELWEAHPQGMYEGLNMHNKVMRGVCSSCNGYEVKTIGDSFMVAFDAAQDAVRFGLEAQLGLLRTKWPEDLLEHPLCRPIAGPEGAPLWSGLRVRIGLQYGPVRVESNPVTGRGDYFGHTVNTAARLESALRKGGMVAATDAVVDSFSPEVWQSLSSPERHDAGHRQLKGVRDRLHVWAIAPRGLAKRFEALQDFPSVQTAMSRHDSSPGSVPGIQTPSTPAATPAVGPRQLSLSRRSSRRSSHCSVPVSPSAREAARRQPAHIFTQRMEQHSATCAVVRISLQQAAPVTERFPVFVAAACLSADMTQGIVDTVLSASVAVTWNAGKPCIEHAGAGRRFINCNFRACCHLGAATGGVLSGPVAAGRRSFACIIGGCVDLATALAEEAERCEDHALAIGAVAHEGTAGHCAQLWVPTGGEPLTVWGLPLLGRDSMDKWLGSHGAQQQHRRQTQPDSMLTGLFHRACAVARCSPEEAALLSELELFMESSPSERDEAQLLIKRIARGTVRTRPMPPQWEPGEGVPMLPLRLQHSHAVFTELGVSAAGSALVHSMLSDSPVESSQCTS